VSLTPPKNFSAVLLTPVNNFWAVSLTPAINFWLFGYFWPVSTTPGKKVINCIDVRGLLLLQNYLWPPKSATAADIVIGTSMKTRKGTSQTLIRGPRGRQSYFKPKQHYWRPQGPLIKMCGVFLDATFHGGSNDTIGRWPSSVAGDFADLSPSTFSYPWQLPTSMASLFLWPAINLSPVSLSPAIMFTGVVVTGDKVIAGVVVTGGKVIAGVVVSGDKLFTGINDTGDHWKSVTKINRQCQRHRQ
jgi:hypothetical protein